MLLAVLGALASAGVLMLRKPRQPGQSNPAMARALAIRVGLSIALFLCLLVAWKMGWIRPTGVPISA
jgi:CHASE2 domain-containing sensor protein